MTVLLEIKDWWDRSSVIFSGLLVVIGGAGASLALRTLRAIERQTDALVESQRPKLVAIGHGDPTKTLGDRSARRVEIELENKGLTVAHDLLYETWIEILSFPFDDFTPNATHFRSPDPVVLYPDATPLVINIPLQVGVAQEQIEAVVNLRLYVCIRLFVTFRDAFGQRRSNFGYYVQKAGFGILPQYNDSK